MLVLRYQFYYSLAMSAIRRRRAYALDNRVFAVIIILFVCSQIYLAT